MLLFQKIVETCFQVAGMAVPEEIKTRSTANLTTEDLKRMRAQMAAKMEGEVCPLSSSGGMPLVLSLCACGICSLMRIDLLACAKSVRANLPFLKPLRHLCSSNLLQQRWPAPQHLSRRRFWNPFAEAHALLSRPKHMRCCLPSLAEMSRRIAAGAVDDDSPVHKSNVGEVWHIST